MSPRERQQSGFPDAGRTLDQQTAGLVVGAGQQPFDRLDLPLTIDQRVVQAGTHSGRVLSLPADRWPTGRHADSPVAPDQCCSTAEPDITRCPDESCLPSAASLVIVKVEKVAGETPAQSVTSVPSLNEPIGTNTPSALRSQAW